MENGSRNYQSNGISDKLAVNLGPIIENSVIEYHYDGTEKHAKSYDVDEITADLACRIDWRSILGAEDTLEPIYNLRLEDNDSLEKEKLDAQKLEEELVEKVADSFPPDAGPWAGVAKQLHEALENVNNLTDVLRIIKDGNGLVMATVLNQSEDPQQVVSASKAFTWNANRRALLEAKKIFDHYLANHKENSEVELFFRELKEIRKYFLVRKMGDHLIGDLGYRLFGPKWVPQETFDIYRVEESKRAGGLRFNNKKISTMMEVDVPKHLARRTTLTVTVVFDNQNNNLYKKTETEVKKRDADRANEDNHATDSKKDEDDEAFNAALKELESLGGKPNLSRMAYWKNALRWARDTLIYRDLFSQLTRECASLVGRSCCIKNNIMIIALYDDVMLRIEKCESPFVDGDLSVDCDTYLSSMLKFCYFEEVSKAPYHPSFFVSLPNGLGAVMDNRELYGAHSFTKDDIISRTPSPKMLVERMIAITSHYCLVRMAIDILTTHQIAHADPTTTWKWQRCAVTNSVLQVSLSSRGYDFIPKNSFHIRIMAESIEIIAKDGHVINCRRDRDMVYENLLYQSSLYWVTATVLVATRAGYQILHSHMNEFDADYKPAPTVLLLNPCSSRMIYIQLFITGRKPLIATKEIPKAVPVGDNPELDLRQFTELHYERLPGSNFLKKIDNVFAFLRH